MESAGARLKKFRLEKGLSLEEVQKKTKIHLNILKALEEDSLINLSPVYIKGFLKIYCKFLGVEAKDYIPDYKEPLRMPLNLAQRLEKPFSWQETFAAKLSFLKTKEIKRVALAILLMGIFFIGLFHWGRSIPSRSGSRDKARKSEKISPHQPRVPSSQAAARVESAAPIRLGIYAREDCFISLKEDGKVVFQGILKKGRSENWQAKEKIEFSLGNAGAVDLEVNGKRILPLGRRGQAVKNISVDKEGLKTKR